MWGFDVSKNTNLKSLTANSNYTWYNIGNNPNLETVNVGNSLLDPSCIVILVTLLI